jgi:glycosyltransferase involved in cell wall biosynthesis
VPADDGERQTAWLAKIEELRNLCNSRLEERGNRHLPPVMKADDLPTISIVTLTYNRRRLIDLAFHNLMWSDYPLDKIEWIVVEDSDNDQSASDKISAFTSRCEERPNNTFRVTYVPLAKKTPVGEKRNIGCARATNDIILFMDDDDHYPTTSFRRRVAWLLKAAETRAVGCTMMAMYDLKRGTSAVNVPPWGLPIGQRLSEASLAFRKSFWEERPFPATNVAEGESWLVGREREFVEIPPQQILVAMSHGGNIGGRKMPADAKPSCFWGFTPEMLKFLHGLVGMVVEFDDIKTKK